jgi:hypothetical protein
LAAIKPHITEPGKWDSLIEGYNNAIAAAEKCQFKGMRGILDGYLEVAEAMPEVPVPDPNPAIWQRFWGTFDDEILFALAKHCNCNLH